MARIDEGKWLGADEHHREWCVAIYGDGDFSDEGVTLGRTSPHRIHAEADRERMLGEISDEEDHWQAEQRSEVIWRSVGPWQTGEPPVDNTASEAMSLCDRIKAALVESRAKCLEDQAFAVRAAVAAHERAKVEHGEPTLFEAPDDDRAERLLADRLSELTGLSDKKCRTLSYALTHTLAVDGFVLSRRRHVEQQMRNGDRA